QGECNFFWRWDGCVLLKLLYRDLIMKVFLTHGEVIIICLLLLGAIPSKANASLKEACWSDPLQNAVLTSAQLIGIGQPSKGLKGCSALQLRQRILPQM
ncbi:hypothetical protein ACWXWB_19745, partial [Pantoea dispersa]